MMMDKPVVVKNPLGFECPKPNCSCKIIGPGTAQLVLRTPRVVMPIPAQVLTPPDVPKQVQDLLLQRPEDAKETDGWFWRIADMWDFDNIGFSKTTQGDVKYLSCADCDHAPIGYHDTKDPVQEYLVAVDRVAYAAASK